MFVGHYGPSLIAKSLRKAIPLWILFLAVQALDVLWSIFVMLGIEKVRIVPGFTATNPLDLYFMPFTHGLITSLGWSLLAALLYRAWKRDQGWPAAAMVGAAVFSHWILDLIVHIPDLPLYEDHAKVGLGLWNYPAIAFVLEIGVFFGAMFLYFRATRPVVRAGSYAFPIFGVVMLAIQAYVFFGPPPASDRAAAAMALFAYFAFAAVAYWLERKREPNDSPIRG